VSCSILCRGFAPGKDTEPQLALLVGQAILRIFFRRPTRRLTSLVAFCSVAISPTVQSCCIAFCTSLPLATLGKVHRPVPLMHVPQNPDHRLHEWFGNRKYLNNTHICQRFRQNKVSSPYKLPCFFKQTEGACCHMWCSHMCMVVMMLLDSISFNSQNSRNHSRKTTSCSTRTSVTAS
jgi:hypothetical protein